MAPRKLPNCRRIVFSEGRIAASVQLSSVGRRPRWSTNSRRAAPASSSLASATSEIGTASPSNTPGGFVLWELRSTTTTSGIHQAPFRGLPSGAGFGAACCAVSDVTTDRVTHSDRLLPVSERDEYGGWRRCVVRGRRSPPPSERVHAI